MLFIYSMVQFEDFLNRINFILLLMSSSMKCASRQIMTHDLHIHASSCQNSLYGIN